MLDLLDREMVLVFIEGAAPILISIIMIMIPLILLTCFLSLVIDTREINKIDRQIAREHKKKENLDGERRERSN